jgi:hypothetical protein
VCGVQIITTVMACITLQRHLACALHSPVPLKVNGSALAKLRTGQAASGNHDCSPHRGGVGVMHFMFLWSGHGGSQKLCAAAAVETPHAFPGVLASTHELALTWALVGPQWAQVLIGARLVVMRMLTHMLPWTLRGNDAS